MKNWATVNFTLTAEQLRFYKENDYILVKNAEPPEMIELARKI